MCKLSLLNALKLSEPDQIEGETETDIIAAIIARVYTLGYSSICQIGQCDFTKKNYSYDDVFHLSVPGLRMGFPYNVIQVYKDNEWMFECLKRYKLMEVGTFPNTCEYGGIHYHNLPPILKVPRSDGTVQDAVTQFENYGIQVRKSNSDSLNPFVNIYVTLLFNPNIKSINNNEEDIKEISKKSDSVIKDITLEKLIKANPELRDHELILRYFSIPINEDMSHEVKIVSEYFNTYQKNWCEAYLKPSLERITNDGIMNCRFEIY